MNEIMYRLDIDYYSRDYSDKACEVSTPIYSISEGLKLYHEAILEKCIDDSTKAARVHLWAYPNHKTILKNY